MTTLGDPAACDRAASDGDRAAGQLEDSIRQLTSLRGVASGSWQGTAGDSLVGAIDTRRESLVQAQEELRFAASSLRQAASRIREAIRVEEERRRRRTQIVHAVTPEIVHAVTPEIVRAVTPEIVA